VPIEWSFSQDCFSEAWEKGNSPIVVASRPII
jgi:hypothetical protein